MADLWGEIGTTAGEIYTNFVKSEKPSSIAMVKEKVKRKDLVEMAIGWLAREGKIQVNRNGKNITIKIRP